MTRTLTTALLMGLLLALGAASQESTAPEPAAAGQQEEVCVLETNYGTMVFRFFEEGAPKTVVHFKNLVRAGFYDGRRFYRVVAGHVIQAGDGRGRSVPVVEGEFGAAPHVVGAVGLARDDDPDSGSSELYICLAPRPHLDGKYAVFGQLVEGFDVLATIGEVEVNERFVGETAFHIPREPVIIERALLEMRTVKP